MGRDGTRASSGALAAGALARRSHAGRARVRAAVGPWWASWAPDVAVAWRALWTSRLLVWAAGLAGIAAIGVSERRADFDPEGLSRPFGAALDTLVAPAARWDSVWLLSIAQDGYGDSPQAAFFPLYPALAAAGGEVVGSALLAGLAVSLASSLAGLTLVHRLAALELGPAEARWAVVALALFPGSLWLSAVYSEGLFLALSAGAVYAARTGRWAWAGALGALGTATRSAGLVVLVALVLLWWDARRRGRAARPRDLAWLAAVPLGLGAFCALLALDGHDALAPFQAQETWLREFAGPFGGVWDGAVAAVEGGRQLLSGSRTPVFFERAGGDPFIVAAHNLELFAYLLVAVPAVAGALRRLPLAYGAYAVAALALPLSWPVGPQPLMSLPRFLGVLFPLFMWLGWWLARGGRARRAVVLALFAAVLAITSARFATWHWVA